MDRPPVALPLERVACGTVDGPHRPDLIELEERCSLASGERLGAN
ncbi:hypothetical protein [Streptomyces sp. NBC_01353]|nr:hypothetical protein [Streptomyces sp. NBC_01353]